MAQARPPAEMTPRPGLVTLADLPRFDTLIDVRSPAEFADDHIPGAINCPVLDDLQRAEVGTLYVQESPFIAKKRGAALISENIARHLHTVFDERPINWRPAIYCWRGGMRSGAMTTILQAIGWKAGQLQGGYKAYRQAVLEQLADLPARFDWRVLCGPTGSGKSRLLQHLAAQGAQVIDLEQLANHRGSLLGATLDDQQPSQKWFESQLCAALKALDPARPVFIEAESRTIGRLRLPEQLLHAMHAGECIVLAVPLAARIAHLCADYPQALEHPDWLKARLQGLCALVGHQQLRQWQADIDARRWPELVAALLEQHYDPLYRHSQGRHFLNLPQARQITLETLDKPTLAQVATALLNNQPV